MSALKDLTEIARSDKFKLSEIMIVSTDFYGLGLTVFVLVEYAIGIAMRWCSIASNNAT